MNPLRPLTGILLLGLTLRCGGGGGGGASTPPPPVYASSLAYTDPAGTGFRLVKNAALSTPAKLVLELVGPSGQNGQGIAFILSTDASKVSWGTPPAAAGLVESLAFNVGGSNPALVGKDKGGGVLHGAAFQKSGSPSLGQPLVRVCLDLKANTVPTGSAVALGFTAGNALSDTGTVSTLSLAVGECVAR